MDRQTRMKWNANRAERFCMGNMTRALLYFVIAPACVAQDQPAFRSDIRLVTISVAAVDPHGAPVRDLQREDFRVFDNGIERRVEHLWIDNDQPLTLGIVVDQSASQAARRAEHQNVISAIAEQVLRPKDRVFVIDVHEDVKLRADYTNKVEALRAALTLPGGLFGEQCPKYQPSGPGLKPISRCGESPLWNAVYAAAKLKLRADKGRKALLMLTDGFDTGSNRTLNEARDEVHKADAAVYAIQYPGGFGGKFAPDLLQLISETGGTRFNASADELTHIMERLAADLYGRYVVAFRPERLNLGKLRHEVRVRVTRPQVSVRVRKTYFAELP
jgi:VWFA-related protein